MEVTDQQTENWIQTTKSITRGIFSGYSQVFFSSDWRVGFIFCMATFVVPDQGISGLAALILSNFWAWLFAFPNEQIKRGEFAYNGLLTGLALGMLYEVNLAFGIMLLISTFIGVLISASLMSLFRQYLFIPVLSFPFVITTWLIYAAGRKFHGLKYTLKPFDITALSDTFPPWMEYVFHSLGAAFFQVSTLAGVLVTIGLFLSSRHAFVLAIIGLTSGYGVYYLTNGTLTDLTINYIGFNFALTAIAVGGIWTIPSIYSLMLAFAGGAVCALISAASICLFTPLNIPPLAFPFAFTVCCIIYALKQRTGISSLKMISVPEGSPEKNIKRYRKAAARYVTGEIPSFDLPVSGEWTITQSFDGEHTHREMWRHAWDFEVLDAEGKAYKDDGLRPGDFFTYNKPVFAPADGKIVQVVNHIDDNPIGQVNKKNNWGNLVIIWHYGFVYSALCHLKKGSIEAKEGEMVRHGQLLGKIGNSGRSPIPHLHFQAQGTPDIGAPTIPSELMHYIFRKDHKNIYHTHGCPKKNERIKSISPDLNIFNTLSFPLGHTWKYRVFSGEQSRTETWKVEIDFSGDRYLVSSKAKIRFFINQKVLIMLDYIGPRNTSLYWFYMALSRIPMSTDSVYWNDELPGELLLSPLPRIVFDFFEPFFPITRLNSQSRFTKSGSNFSVETIINSKNSFTNKYQKRLKANLDFTHHKGLKHLNIYEHDHLLIKLDLLKT